MSEAFAPAKINLALVVGPRRADGKHEVVTVYERIDLADRISVEPATRLRVEGFADDTLVGRALHALAAQAGVEPSWRVRIEKRIPVSAGLGGGSSDAATALRLANAFLDRPFPPDELHALAVTIGADVPFFLVPGPQLGERDGTELSSVELPRDYWVLVLLPEGSGKQSTAAVYAAFDRRGGANRFEQRRAALYEGLGRLRAAGDLALLPRNDLASSDHTEALEQLGAFRSDVTGAGPGVYGLFEEDAIARRAAARLESIGRCWIARPTWYG